MTEAGHDSDVVTSDGVNIRHPTSDWQSTDARWPRFSHYFLFEFPNNTLQLLTTLIVTG